MNWKLASVALMASMAMIACTPDDGSDAGSGVSRVNVRMTDAPGPYDEVNVEIVGVEIHSDVNGWNTLPMTAPGVYNLLDFTNGLDTLIASANLPSGKISQLRLILGDNNSVMIGGTSYPLTTPSAQQSGLKLQIHQNLIPDITYTILLDFDASQSIIETGKGKYILKPVLRTITEGIDGIIQGNLDPDMEAQIWAIHNGDTFGTYSDSSGAFMIKGLAGATYQVDILPPAPYSDTSFSGVTVVNGQITNMGTLNIQ